MRVLGQKVEFVTSEVSLKVDISMKLKFQLMIGQKISKLIKMYFFVRSRFFKSRIRPES